jgi:hypothetical protein
MYNECYNDGKVYTRPRMGASYYHSFVVTPFCMILSLYFDSFVDMAIFYLFLLLFFLLFFSWTFMCPTFFSFF